MFTASKNVVCLLFQKSSLTCALAQVNGKKVDIVSIDSIDFDEGVLVDGIIYDKSHLEEVVKNLITSVTRGVNEVQAAWMGVPDNKIVINKFDIAQPTGESVDSLIAKSLENKLNAPINSFYSIITPIHEINKRIFFLSYSIRKEHLDPFVDILNSIGIPIASIFPTFEAIYRNLREYIKHPTLVLYPSDFGYKFFLGDSDGVHLESVWGHNVIELNENFDKAINEIINYTKQTKEIALGIKKILVVEGSPDLDEKVQSYLTKLNIEYLWVPSGVDQKNTFTPTSILSLKGLITLSMQTGGLDVGFYKNEMQYNMSDQSRNQNFMPQKQENIIASSYNEERGSNTMVKNSDDYEEKWNFKVLITTFVLVVLVLSGLIYIGIRLTDTNEQQTAEQTQDDNEEDQNEPSPTDVESTPTEEEITPSVTEVVETTPSPTPAPPDKEEVAVKVFNGNSVGGEASRVSGLVSNQGFATETPENYTRFDVQSTSIEYNAEILEVYANEIADVLSEAGYPSANAVFKQDNEREITVIIGAR